MLPKSLRLALVSLHVALTAIWIGGASAVLALHATKRGVDAGVDRAAFLLHDGLVTWTSYAVIATAIAMSSFTPWGFFRFWWVSLKWLVLVALGALLAGWSTLAINRVAALSDVALATHGVADGYAEATSAAIVSQSLTLALLLATVAVSVVKPWGRTPWGHREDRHRKLRGGLVVAMSAAGAGGAWWQMSQLARMRAAPVAAISPRELGDGVYRGTFQALGRSFVVDVEVERGALRAVRAPRQPTGSYLEMARGVVDKMVAAQRVDVDAVTGATTSSRGYQHAAACALRGGPGCVDARR